LFSFTFPSFIFSAVSQNVSAAGGGMILVRWKYFLPVLGISICLIETGYPLFIWMKKTRLIWLICVLGMHIAIGLTMGMYLFALVMMVLNIAAFGPDFSITETKGYVVGGTKSVPV
jgi:hypothetical protein